jgi:ligand-binding SRPBCC domain-containing protein
MPEIHLTTFITAPAERVFDLSRSITFHEQSMAHTGEKAIGGVTSGLINLNETVTWQATHFFKKRVLESKITAMTPYTFFEDTMVKGDFASLRHEHHFKQIKNGTIMIDLFNYESPYGIAGKIANTMFLTRYLKSLLVKRNLIVKEFAETDKWEQVLGPVRTA